MGVSDLFIYLFFWYVSFLVVVFFFFPFRLGLVSQRKKDLIMAAQGHRSDFHLSPAAWLSFLKGEGGPWEFPEGVAEEVGGGLRRGGGLRGGGGVGRGGWEDRDSRR